MEIEIRKATIDDAIHIAKHMRSEDVCEIWASDRKTPLDALFDCLAQRESLCALAEGRPTVMFGCSDYRGYGVPWLLATDDICKLSVRFVMESREYVAKWLTQYELLTNHVYAKNSVSIKWLRWLGFEIKEKVCINNEPFYRFEIRR